MLQWKAKRARQEEIQRLTAPNSDDEGVNRRAINLVPLPEFQEKRQIVESHQLRYQHLLLSIEAKQSTCCLRMVNPATRTRAAILVFRGRVLGCLYGRKDLPETIFGKVAHRLASIELAHAENILDTYLLSEELAIAGAAVFHGVVLKAPEGAVEAQFEWACMHLTRTYTPGCIIVNNGDGLAIATIYMFGGRIQGVYSFKRGWLAATYEAAVRHVLNTKGATIVAKGLFVEDVRAVQNLTFSLTGLADKNAAVGSGAAASTGPEGVKPSVYDSRPAQNDSVPLPLPAVVNGYVGRQARITMTRLAAAKAQTTSAHFEFLRTSQRTS